jgi:tetratricopeptide (TPR) repeat protein
MAEAVGQAMSAMKGDLDLAIEGTLQVVMGGAGAALGSWIRPLLYCGQFEQALESFSLLPPGSDGHPLLKATRACCLAAAGRLDLAREIHRELTEQFPAGTEEDFTDLTIGPFLELALLVDDTTTVERLYLALMGRNRGRRYVTQGGFCLPHLIGNAAAALGRFDEARAQYEEALAFSQKIRHRPEIALTRLDLAELLLEHYPDERDAAIEHLDFAISEFREMKMQPALERALRHRGLLKA